MTTHELAQQILDSIEAGNKDMRQAVSETYEVGILLSLVDDIKELCQEQVQKAGEHA